MVAQGQTDMGQRQTYGAGSDGYAQVSVTLPLIRLILPHIHLTLPHTPLIKQVKMSREVIQKRSK